MATEDIKIRITAEDKASGILSNIGGAAGKLGGVLGTLAKTAGVAVVAGFGAMAAFGVSSVKAFIDAEKEMVVANRALQNSVEEMSGKQLEELNRTLGATGSSFVALQGKMEEVGKAAVKLGFDDEAASVAFAKLFSVTQDVTKSQEQLKLAMDLAAFSGQSLEAATSALVKVHAGGTRVLKEFGIEVEEGTTAAEALALVQTKVGGTAADMANTTAGKLQVLSLSWQNLQETVGGALATAITPFIDKLVTWAQNPETQDKINEIAQGFANFAAQMAPIVEALLPKFIAVVKVAIEVLQGLARVFTVHIPDGIVMIENGIKSAIQTVNNFIDRISSAIQKARELASSVGSTAANVGNAIVPFGNPFGKKQFGGQVQANKSFLVGERGPELFTPGVNGAITPSNRLGGGNIVVNITGTFLSQDAAEAMANMMIDQLKLEVRM